MAAVVTPADYLRTRRLFEGLTIVEAAVRLVGPLARAIAEDFIRNAELPGAVVYVDGLINLYARVLRFDADVYRQLRDDPVDRHPTLCAGCCCSAWQPCLCGDGQDCTIDDDGSCTACAERASRHRRAA